MLKKKGIFPYEYLNSFNRFKETSLPDKRAFYSRLLNSKVTDQEYEHAINVWNKFNMKTFGEYHDIYLKTDVLLLIHFKNFLLLKLKNFSVLFGITLIR